MANAVDRPADDPGRVQPVVAQGGDECLCVPVAKGDMIEQTCPARGPSGCLGHVGLERGLIDETYAHQHVTHEGLTAADPDIACPRDFRPLLPVRQRSRTMYGWLPRGKGAVIFGDWWGSAMYSASHLR